MPLREEADREEVVAGCVRVDLDRRCRLGIGLALKPRERVVAADTGWMGQIHPIKIGRFRKDRLGSLNNKTTIFCRR